jgi:hypothetical protein
MGSVTGYARVEGPVSTASQVGKTVEATCPTGTLLVGGGFRTTGRVPLIIASFPVSETTWQVTTDTTRQNHTVQAFAICVNAQP